MKVLNVICIYYSNNKNIKVECMFLPNYIKDEKIIKLSNFSLSQSFSCVLRSNKISISIFEKPNIKQFLELE
jgi:hypothetical protein